MERQTIKKITPAAEDARGAIMDVFDGKNIRHIGHITSKKGSVRGNHYHGVQTQYTYILHGKAYWYTKDLNDPAARVERVMLQAGELAVDLPRVCHALEALEDTEFIFFTDAVRTDDGYEKDTVRVDIASEWKQTHPGEA
jgi:dTDP-4-dehydrorhamnose 3,5-epimerase-like enzyme